MIISLRFLHKIKKFFEKLRYAEGAGVDHYDYLKEVLETYYAPAVIEHMKYMYEKERPLREFYDEHINTKDHKTKT